MLFTVFAAACAHGNASVPLGGTSLLPAAQGTVTLSKKDQANQIVRVVVHHLAPPENLNPSSVELGSHPAAPQTYVVWIQPMNGGPAENVGVLVPDKNLDAELTTTTAQHKFDLFVTAEASPTQTTPTGQHLMQANVQD